MAEALLRLIPKRRLLRDWSNSQPTPPNPASAANRLKDADILRRILPASTSPQDPENPLQHPAVLDPRPATAPVLGWFREQGHDLLPLRFGQQSTGSRHRPSLGAADSVYPSFRKAQPFCSQTLVLGYAQLLVFYGVLGLLGCLACLFGGFLGSGNCRVNHFLRS